MPLNVSPTPFILPLPPLEIISLDATSYGEILQSLSGTTYEIFEIYLKANSNSQIFQPLMMNKKNAEGNIEKYNLVTVIDPTQFNPALNIDISKKRLILDGLNNINYTILPGENVFMFLSVIQAQNTDLLPPDFIFMDDDEFFNK